MRFGLHGGRVQGNREVSRREFLDARGARVEACLREEEARRGTWFPRGSEPQARDVEVE